LQRPGLLLTKIVADSAAARAGLRVGDRIMKFDGRDVVGQEEFRQLIVEAVNPVTLAVERKDEPEPIELEVNLDGRPVRLGIAWRADAAEPKSVFLVRVVGGSAADRAGLKVGDRIYEINGLTFADSDQFRELLKTLPAPLEILVEREGRLMTITVEVAKPGGMARVERGLRWAA
jgi:regulator of sigma E protease